MEDITDVMLWLLASSGKSRRGPWSLTKHFVSLAFEDAESRAINQKPGWVFQAFCFIFGPMVFPFVISRFKYKEVSWFAKFFRDYRTESRVMLRSQQHLWNSQPRCKLTVLRMQSQLVFGFVKYLIYSSFLAYWQSVRALPQTFREPEQLVLPFRSRPAG